MVGRAERFTVAGLSVTDESVDVGELSILGGALVMSRLEYAFDVRRQTSYYFWKVFIPLSIANLLVTGLLLLIWDSFVA